MENKDAPRPKCDEYVVCLNDADLHAIGKSSELKNLQPGESQGFTQHDYCQGCFDKAQAAEMNLEVKFRY